LGIRERLSSYEDPDGHRSLHQPRAQDYLEVATELGIFGCVILASVVVLVGVMTFRPGAQTVRRAVT